MRVIVKEVTQSPARERDRHDTLRRWEVTMVPNVIMRYLLGRLVRRCFVTMVNPYGTTPELKVEPDLKPCPDYIAEAIRYQVATEAAALPEARINRA